MNMNVNIEKKPYQENHFFTGDVIYEGLSYPYTLEVINVHGVREEDIDYFISWQNEIEIKEEAEKLIIEQYNENTTVK
jgi:hypothetical protein